MSEKQCTWKGKINPVYKETETHFLPFLCDISPTYYLSLWTYQHGEWCSGAQPRYHCASALVVVKARDICEALRQLMKECSESLWMTIECWQGVKKKRVLKFFFFSLLLMCLPKMNWLLRFKTVHGWNTERGSSISPWIVRENPMALWKAGARGGVCCWSLIRPWASSTQELAA